MTHPPNMNSNKTNDNDIIISPSSSSSSFRSTNNLTPTSHSSSNSSNSTTTPTPQLHVAFPLLGMMDGHSTRNNDSNLLSSTMMNTTTRTHTPAVDNTSRMMDMMLPSTFVTMDPTMSMRSEHNDNILLPSTMGLLRTSTAIAAADHITLHQALFCGGGSSPLSSHSSCYENDRLRMMSLMTAPEVEESCQRRCLSLPEILDAALELTEGTMEYLNFLDTTEETDSLMDGHRRIHNHAATRSTSSSSSRRPRRRQRRSHHHYNASLSRSNSHRTRSNSSSSNSSQ